MRVVARLPWQEIGWGTPLARAFAAGQLDPALAPRSDVDAGRSGLAPALLDAIRSEMPPPLRAAWAPLERSDAGVVVTGQQPGCVGGPLLVLYKAATAVALARQLAHELRRPVVPVFWNATDDEDFEEIASIGWPDGGELAYLQLPRSDRRAGAWVGDLPAAGDVAAYGAARGLLDEAGSAALDRMAPREATDHGTWVAAWLAGVFPELAVLDARSAALRVHGAPLFARYLEQRQAARTALEAGIGALGRAGFAPTLDAASLRSALFLTPERRREKLGADLEPLRRAVAEAPHTVSPNVVLRALLQDTVLPTLAHVVGPAEIGYLLELRPLRALLDSPEPLLVPRLTLSVLPEPAARAAEALGLDPRAIVTDPDAALRAVGRSVAADSEATLGRAFATLQASLAELPVSPTAIARSNRRLSAIEAALLEDVRTRARDALLVRHAALDRLPALLRPRGQAQERIVAGMWLASLWGEETGRRLVELATDQLAAARRRQPEHALVST